MQHLQHVFVELCSKQIWRKKFSFLYTLVSEKAVMALEEP